MIITHHFEIDELKPSDASCLNRLMVSNTARFKDFFPRTLNQNLTCKASKDYIALKIIENHAKVELTYAIRNKLDQKVIGLIILKEIDWKKYRAELAYCIDLEFEGRGWMTQAIAKYSKFAIDNLGMNTLRIIVHHTNKGSIRIAQKCGFKYQGILKEEHEMPVKGIVDMDLYEINVPNHA